MDLLEVKNISKTYGSGETAVKALKNVSFSVPKGEYVAIVGESGSGKSTLLNMIGALDMLRLAGSCTQASLFAMSSFPLKTLSSTINKNLLNQTTSTLLLQNKNYHNHTSFPPPHTSSINLKQPHSSLPTPKIPLPPNTFLPSSSLFPQLPIPSPPSPPLTNPPLLPSPNHSPPPPLLPIPNHPPLPPPPHLLLNTINPPLTPLPPLQFPSSSPTILTLHSFTPLKPFFPPS